MGNRVSAPVRRRTARAALRVAMLGSMLAIGCGGPAKEGGQGAECFRAEECAAGLVCIERVCTSDVTSVNFPADAGLVVDAGLGPAD